MPTINQLSGLDQVSTGDLLPIYVPTNGDARKVSVGKLLELFQRQFASPTLSVQFSTPGTGFNVGIQTPVSQQLWLLIQPASTLASGTVTLPLNTQTPDGTELLVTTTQQITTFTVAANGASSVYGGPSTLSATGYFRLRYFSATNSWYRIA